VAECIQNAQPQKDKFQAIGELDFNFQPTSGQRRWLTGHQQIQSGCGEWGALAAASGVRQVCRSLEIAMVDGP
jgi:hypothetical protein